MRVQILIDLHDDEFETTTRPHGYTLSVDPVDTAGECLDRAVRDARTWLRERRTGEQEGA